MTQNNHVGTYVYTRSSLRLWPSIYPIPPVRFVQSIKQVLTGVEHFVICKSNRRRVEEPFRSRAISAYIYIYIRTSIYTKHSRRASISSNGRVRLGRSFALLCAAAAARCLAAPLI